jgi:hypothetical protein
MDSLFEQQRFEIAGASHDTKDYDVLAFDSIQHNLFTNRKAADACLQIIPSAASAWMRSK